MAKNRNLKEIEEDYEDGFIGLANNLPLSDLLRLIDINKDRIMVFDYEQGHVSSIDNVNMNGTSIQITTNSALD
jgi:6-phosphogluconolactonase (cycloisomerase 2 family)